MHHLPFPCIIVLLLSWPGIGLAEPVIIDSLGITTSVAPYLKTFNQKNNRPQALPASPVPPPPIPGLPVSSPGLSSGDVTDQFRSIQHLQKPLCLVGSDERSIQWAERQHPSLKKINAACLLIEAKTVNDVLRMKKALNGIPLFAISAESLIKPLKLTHYPVLITSEGVFQ